MQRVPRATYLRSAALALRALTVLACGTAAAAAAAPDSAALVARLARQAPAGIAFTEVRFSPLLAEPLVVGGTLVHEGQGTLQRRVERPYAETTTIGGETVRLERDGERPRTFALRRAPELRGFVTGMLGMLRGDSALLDEHFDVAASGDDARWRLELTPDDERLRERLRTIIVTGRDAEPRCFAVVDTAGGTSVMLLGELAGQPLPPPIVLAELMGRCAE